MQSSVPITCSRRRRRTRTTAVAVVATTSLLLSYAPTALSFVPAHNLVPYHHSSGRFSHALSVSGAQRMSLYVDDETAGVAPSSGKSKTAATTTGNSFQRRMRDRYLQTQQPQQRQTRQQQEQQLPDNVQHVESLSDYKSAITKAGDRTVVVRFFAKWCKTCRSIAPAFYKLARLNPDVVFLDVPVLDTNTALHQGLGIPSVPYAYIYYKGVLVEEMKMTRQRFPAFVSKVKMYSRGTCECVGEECDVPAEGMEKGGQL